MISQDQGSYRFQNQVLQLYSRDCRTQGMMGNIWLSLVQRADWFRSCLDLCDVSCLLDVLTLLIRILKIYSVEFLFTHRHLDGHEET